MGSLNLQALIDQVLGITKEAWDMKKRKLDEGLSGHEQTQQRNYEIQKEQNKNRAALELAGINESGARARQLLMSQSAANVAEIAGKAHLEGEKEKAEATRYSADKTLEAHKKLLHPEQVKGWTAILSDVTSPEVDKKAARSYILKDFNNTSVDPLKSFDDGKDNPVTPTRPTASAITPATSVTPASPVVQSKGAESMEFRDGPSPEQIRLGRKKQEENLLYGTKPQNRGWLNSLFN